MRIDIGEYVNDSIDIHIVHDNFELFKKDVPTKKLKKMDMGIIVQNVEREYYESC